MDDLLELVDDVCSLAVEAGNVLLAERAGIESSVRTKANVNDLVSAADFASERLIVERLHALRPHDSILSEEGTEVAGTNDFRWVIDPLDGTRNYIDGCGPFAVSIGLERHGEPVLGVIRDPLGEATYSAVEGRGAWRNGQSLAASTRERLDESLIGFSLLPSADGLRVVADVLSELVPHIGDFRRLGSAVTQLALVSAGALDATVSMGVKRWDVSAGIVIAREAGATVLGMVDERPNETLTIAAAPAIAHQLRDEIVDVINSA
jgi:myo-inositol-1(or 4)-monophosphatase